MSLLFIDGKAVEFLPASDRGFQYGHGLFETMRLWEGKLPLLNSHLARLHAGAKSLSIDCDLVALNKQLDNALSEFPDQGLVKLVLTAGDGLRGYRYDNEGRKSRPRHLIQFFELSAGEREAQLTVCEYRLPHNPRLAGIKHLNRLDQVMAAAQLPPNCDGLMLDHVGNIIEAVSSNIFMLSGNQWITPSLDKAGVAGVMRQFLLDEVMPAIGCTPLCEDIDIVTLQNAEEVFICNAVRGIIPVTQVTGVAEDLVFAGNTNANPPTQTALIQAELSKHQPCFGE